MGIIKINGANIYYEDTGGEGKETIIFSHGFFYNTQLFEKQVEKFRNQYRVITYDFRGHGKSEVTREGYDLEAMVDDSVKLITALNAIPCHFAGHSMGAFAGIEIAAHYPELIRSLLILDSAADLESAISRTGLKIMTWVVRLFGLSKVVDSAMISLLGKTFLNDPADKERVNEIKKRILANDPVGIVRSANGLLKRPSIEDCLVHITVPVLSMVGEEAVQVTLERAKSTADRIKGATFVVVPKSGHTSVYERPEVSNNIIENFLARLNSKRAETKGTENFAR